MNNKRRNCKCTKYSSFFTNIRNSIIEKLKMENVDNEFLEKISKTEFTKPGIILSRSRIPYILKIKNI